MELLQGALEVREYELIVGAERVFCQMVPLKHQSVVRTAAMAGKPVAAVLAILEVIRSPFNLLAERRSDQLLDLPFVDVSEDGGFEAAAQHRGAGGLHAQMRARTAGQLLAFVRLAAQQGLQVEVHGRNPHPLRFRPRPLIEQPTQKPPVFSLVEEMRRCH